MLCRNCGTEIADKAIVCFRCGTSTTDPVRKAVPIKKRRGVVLPFVTVVMLLMLALYMGQASRTAADPGRAQLIAGVLAVAAVVILLFRVIVRRR